MDLLAWLTLATAFLIITQAPTRADAACSFAAGPVVRNTSLPPDPTTQIALSFGGSGFLTLFQLGVLDELRDLGVVSRFTATVGVSGGVLVAYASCLGLSRAHTERIIASFTAYCRRWNSCAGHLDGAVRATTRLAIDSAFADALARNETDAMLGIGGSSDKDAFVRARCAGRGAAYVTRLIRPENSAAPPSESVDSQQLARASVAPVGRFNRSEQWRVDDYSGAEDLVDAAAASAYLPYLSAGPHGFTQFRGELVHDGAFAYYRNLLAPPCHDASKASRSGRETVTTAVKGGDDSADAEIAPTCVRVGVIVAPVKPGNPEISPGKFLPLPPSLAKRWTSFLLSVPSTDELVDAIVQHGRQSALAWAREVYGPSVGSKGASVEGSNKA